MGVRLEEGKMNPPIPQPVYFSRTARKALAAFGLASRLGKEIRGDVWFDAASRGGPRP
jgi:hypothetical protein